MIPWKENARSGKIHWKSIYFRTVHHHSKVNIYSYYWSLNIHLAMSVFDQGKELHSILNEFPIVFTFSAILFSGTNAEVHFKYTQKKDFQFIHANIHPGRAHTVVQTRNRHYFLGFWPATTEQHNYKLWLFTYQLVTENCLWLVPSGDKYWKMATRVHSRNKES